MPMFSYKLLLYLYYNNKKEIEFHTPNNKTKECTKNDQILDDIICFQKMPEIILIKMIYY